MIQRQLLRLSKRVDDGKLIKLFDSSLLPVLFCHEIGVIGYMLPKPINYSVFAALADNDTGVQPTSYCYNFLGNIPRTSYHIDKSTRRRWHIAFCSIVFF